MTIITLHETEQRAAVKLPLGCDQQGRYPEAVHVATDIGADAEEWFRTTWRDELWFWGGIVAGLSVLGALIALAYGVDLWAMAAGWLQ